MYEYLRKADGRRKTEGGARRVVSRASKLSAGSSVIRLPSNDGVDRTPKLFIAGKQARPDSGYSRIVTGPKGQKLGEVGDGNRKDIRNAVEAAHAAAKGWSKSTGHLRAQILYYIAENLSARGDEFAARLRAMTGADRKSVV